MRKRSLAAGAALAACLGLGGSALAGHLSEGVKSYTGCLTTSGGTLSLIKEGDSPQKNPCPSGSVIAHLSGGDITAVLTQAGGGLTGGAGNGAATLSLRRDCADAGVLKWNGSTSAWGCGTDSDSAYTEGPGIDITGNEVSVDPDYRVKNTGDCTSGSFATGFDSDGAMSCAAPTPASVQAFSGSAGEVTVAGLTTIISKTLAAGNYVVNAHVEVNAKGELDDGAGGHCDIPGDRGSVRIVAGRFENPNVTLTAAVAHAGGALLLTCTEKVGDFDVENASLSAIKVGSIG